MAMNPRIKEALQSTLFLKAMAVIIGFMFWNVISESFTASRWLTVPVCFYNKSNQKIEAPETVMIELHAKRTHLRALDPSTIAAHIDVSTLIPGPQRLAISRDILLLPSTIAVHETIPHTLFITITVPTDTAEDRAS